MTVLLRVQSLIENLTESEVSIIQASLTIHDFSLTELFIHYTFTAIARAVAVIEVMNK